MKKTVSTIILALFIFTLTVNAEFEQWIPTVPQSEQVELNYLNINGTSYVTCSITFPTSGYNITGWGTPAHNGSNTTVNAEIWRWTGVVLQVIITIRHTYNLGNLPPGENTFTFKVWRFTVKQFSFKTRWITVPDDYPTIQGAINAASLGDTVFVRAGVYYEHVVVNKTISLIGEDKDSTILNGATIEPIMIMEANDVKISGFTFEGWAFQNILINATTGATIAENKIVFNALGIDVENSVNTTIENNIINGFGLDNIGIMLAYSSGCSIVNNTITNAIYDGIRLWFSSSNLIHQNRIKDNDYGIFFHEAKLNTISENTISESGGPGIYIESSSTNEFLHNSFIDNYHQAMICDNSVNTWDNGCEGNYWSDYNGTDSNGDGIGDAPYIINSNNRDNYPLMNPHWNPSDVNHDLKVNLQDVLKTALAFGSYPGHPKWNPHCDVNQDGRVDLKDHFTVCKNYGKTLA